jgi:RHS repeat-associated protein
VTYTRGSDLSGSSEGAGGIGGLLARTDNSTINPQHAYYHADGNGNVTTLIDTNQVVVARYTYEPFGNVFSMSGPLACANLYRFSSKEADPASGLIYYLYRYYDSTLQRWMNRDPLSDSWQSPSEAWFLSKVGPWEFYGGGNLYHFVYNGPTLSVDSFGLDLYIVRDKGGKGHEWVVGDNGDGTYWDSDKNPGKGGFRFFGTPLNCPSDVEFRPKSQFDPKNLSSAFRIRKHMRTSGSVDQRVRDDAKRRADADEGRYDACAKNCRTYADGLLDYAKGQKLREAAYGR